MLDIYIDIMDFPTWRQKWQNSILMTIILKRLSESQTYGREVVEYTQQLLGSEIKIPTVYSMLKRLNEGDYIETIGEKSKAPETRGTRRKYYELTSSGKQYLTDVRQVLGKSMEIIEMVMKE